MTEEIDNKKNKRPPEPKNKKNTAEEIMRKLEKLEKLKMMLRDPRISVEDIDEDELDALLSRAEVMEEALKNYMYQFGMSLYQNKKGDNYFKKFMYDSDIRNYSELDGHNFFINEREPSFLEKLLEYTPPERVDLKESIENVVFDLYERDASMVDAFNEVVSEEVERCKDILQRVQESKLAKGEAGKQLEEVVEQEQLNDKLLSKEAEKENLEELAKELQDDGQDLSKQNLDKDEDVRVISVEEIELDLLPDEGLIEDELINDDLEYEDWQEGYESGSDTRGSKVRLPKVDKVRRVRKPKPIVVPNKDNIQDR